MFKRRFIKKYKFDVIRYLDSTFVPPPYYGRCYALDLNFDNDSDKSEQSKAEENKNECTSDIKYSDRRSPKDNFDPKLVSELMRINLNEDSSIRSSISAVNLSFVQKVQEYIKNKGLLETDVYKAAHIDRKLFSKMICSKNYTPSKDTVLAIIFGLRLSYEEAVDLLERAGYALSHSIKRDIIIEYFIKAGEYNLNNINAFLYNMNERPIGRNL